MLTLMLLSSLVFAGDTPDFVPPDPTLLAALPAEQREMLLSAQIADNADPQGEERLLMALMVSQRFGEGTSADTPELLPTLADALSEDAGVRGAALARAGTTQAATTPAKPQASLSISAGISVAVAPKSAVLRSASGRRLPQAWRRLSVLHVPAVPGAEEAYGGWVVVDGNGDRLDGLDLARALQHPQQEEVLTARRRRAVINAAVGAGAGVTGFLLGPSVIWFAPVLGLVGIGAGLTGIGIAVASPLLWKRQKMQFDRWFVREDVLQRIEAHNVYWSSQMPQRAGRTPPPQMPSERIEPPAAPAAPDEPVAPTAPAEPSAPAEPEASAPR